MHFSKKVELSQIPGVQLRNLQPITDDRGWFMEVARFHLGAQTQQQPQQQNIAQVNLSWSKKDVLRGLHLQSAPHEQAKSIRVLAGSVFDVMLDLRRDSPTYRQWAAVHLSHYNHQELIIPRGMAHGYLVTSAESLILYSTDSHYHPDSEIAIAWDDPDLRVDWPLHGSRPITSPRDSQGMSLAQYLLAHD
ncbi:MAG: dTDP-4-dehydrorhamnose 3,5-epimerase [Prosthecobacter sp.]|jgi:dTDP-4-dehydrorhamnose 3,5-epimerase|uniref:dTDP-4-dehydrorhamnose 3,5-epimerase n=1 Tax=Prosthecobacter sp. TaxID=1965333 RepID=UPI0019F911B6|nr:dTDP-4-dehydrorhamnose 3,5-epimerase [Prosthecobacter sp.]MBE2282710.1 dTDP-4-dehydrorhamnose 3,5-epimerase [Prosthecobacter sp.]